MKARTAPPGCRSAASSRRLRPQILSGFIAPEAIRPSPTALADTAPALPGPPDAASPFPREKAHVALNGLPWGREAVPFALCEYRFGIRLVRSGPCPPPFFGGPS